MGLLLEDFDIAHPPTSPANSDMISRSMAETEKVATYEQGYQAGWDDATLAEAEDQSRIAADFARNLQDLSFTFHEARAHVIQTMEPLLNALVGKLLPDLVSETMGLRIIEELRPLIEDAADAPIELVVATASIPALEKQLANSQIGAIQLRQEPSLAEGQAFLRVGKSERKIDLTAAFEAISMAIASLHSLNERTLKHA